MQASKAGVNLLTLPAEIRHRIFLLVLIVDRQYSVEGPGGTRLIELADFEMLSDSNCSDWVYYAGNEQWIEQPSLTRVCRQIREETPPVYYSANGFMVNVFHFEHLDYLIDHQDGKHVKLYSYGIQAWLKAIGATNRASIKTLILMNDQTTAMRVSAKRFATALREGGVGLNEGVIKSFEKDYDLRKRTTIWKEVTAEDDNISSEASVEWTLTW